MTGLKQTAYGLSGWWDGRKYPGHVEGRPFDTASRRIGAFCCMKFDVPSVIDEHEVGV